MDSNPSDKPSLILTGSSGLIGSRLVKRFTPEYRIFALDVSEPEEELPADARFLEIDLTDDDSVEDVVREIDVALGDSPVASVVHLAAYYDFSGEPSPMYDEVTVKGTGRLLGALQRRNVPVEQFLFSSTMLVHAPTEPGAPIDEDHPLKAKWDYPQSKIDTEELIRREHGDIPAVLLRIAGAYTDECDSIPIAQQIQRIHDRTLTSHVYPGDTSRGQAFVHMDDLVDAIARTVGRRHELPSGAVPILVGEPDTYSYGDIQRELGRLIHDEPDWTTEQIPKAVAKSGAWIQDKVPGIEEPFIKPWMIDLADDHYELDIGRARELLGWEPVNRIMDTLPSIVANLTRDPEGWYEHHGLGKPRETPAKA